MLIKLPFADQDIIDCLNINYGIEVAALTFLPLGADINASVYKAETQNQLSYFIKLKRGHHHEISLTIIELLQNAGMQPIIPPVKTIQGQTTQRIDNFTLIVYPFIDAQDGFSRALTDEQWRTLGKALRQVHEVNVPPSIQHQLRRETYSPKWREMVRSLYTHIKNKPISDEIALKLSASMKEHARVIHRLVDRAEQLAEILQNESPKFVLCHSDLHGGNVLLDEDNALYIVDWDDPIMAPKERDLMFIGGGICHVWNKPREEVIFYEGYGETEINRAILSYYRHERIVEDIADFGQTLLLTTAGGKDRLQSYRHFAEMFEPGGVVDIAFKTDEGVDI